MSETVKPIPGMVTEGERLEARNSEDIVSELVALLDVLSTAAVAEEWDVQKESLRIITFLAYSRAEVLQEKLSER